MKQKIQLVLERESSSEKLWGRMKFRDELIVNAADSFEELLKDTKRLLQEAHQINPETLEFELSYDLTALFKEKSFLNLTAVADRLGMNRSQLAQCAAGIKHPSLKTAVRIVQVLHGFGNELRSIRIAVNGVPLDYFCTDEEPELSPAAEKSAVEFA